MSGSRKKSTKRRIVRIVVIVDIILAILVAIVLYLKSRVAEEYGSGSETEIQTATVSEGSISTTVSGTGNLTDEDVETIEIVNTVEIEEICVSAGDVVAEGDLLAKVDMSTVVAAMSTLQQELDTLDSQIDEAEDDAVAAISPPRWLEESRPSMGRKATMWPQSCTKMAHWLFYHWTGIWQWMWKLRCWPKETR